MVKKRKRKTLLSAFGSILTAKPLVLALINSTCVLSPVLTRLSALAQSAPSCSYNSIMRPALSQNVCQQKNTNGQDWIIF